MSCNILTVLTYNPPIDGFFVFRNKLKKSKDKHHGGTKALKINL